MKEKIDLTEKDKIIDFVETNNDVFPDILEEIRELMIQAINSPGVRNIIVPQIKERIQDDIESPYLPEKTRQNLLHLISTNYKNIVDTCIGDPTFKRLDRLSLHFPSQTEEDEQNNLPNENKQEEKREEVLLSENSYFSTKAEVSQKYPLTLFFKNGKIIERSPKEKFSRFSITIEEFKERAIQSGLVSASTKGNLTSKQLRKILINLYGKDNYYFFQEFSRGKGIKDSKMTKSFSAIAFDDSIPLDQYSSVIHGFEKPLTKKALLELFIFPFYGEMPLSKTLIESFTQNVLGIQINCELSFDTETKKTEGSNSVT